MKLVLEFSRYDLGKLPIAVIIENRGKCVGREASGSKRRKYEAEFTEHERKVLYSHHALFYRWIISAGFPKRHTFRKMETIELIKRAGSFFASV